MEVGRDFLPQLFEPRVAQKRVGWDKPVEDDVWDVDLSLDKLTSDSFSFLTASVDEGSGDKPKENVC